MSHPAFDFRLKHFGIRQTSTAMKVGTDAIVLGSWISSFSLNVERILDIGTGTGIILLMLMQSLNPRKGVGIDISDSLWVDAEYNRLHSPWSERIQLLQQDLLSYYPEQGFDLIVSNPPYFEVHGVTCSDNARELARREQTSGLTLEYLVYHATGLLNPQGRFCLITPIDREHDLRRYATAALLRLERRTVVYSRPDRAVRLLTEWMPLSSTESYQSTKRSEFSLRTSEGYVTRDYELLTSPFLLHSSTSLKFPK